MTQKVDVSLVLPVYNEAKRGKLEINVSALDKYLKENDFSYEIIITDDGSTDNTKELAKGLIGRFPKLKVIGYDQNQGRGAALKNIRDHVSGDKIIYMDSDLPASIDLEHLRKICDALDESDISIASRFHPDTTIVRKWHRAFISIVYRFIVRCVFIGFPVTDPDVGFKGFRTKTFKKVIPWTNLQHWSWDLQFLITAFNMGYKIKEIPFNWVEEYDSTTVNILRDSVSEFFGLLYIKVKGVLDYKHLPKVNHELEKELKKKELTPRTEVE